MLCQSCRWKQILEAYNEVRARLLNSQPLLEGTNLVLFSINETTLSRWYKNSTRCTEVKMLLQGLPNIPSSSTATGPLLPALECSTSPPPPPDNPHIFPEAEDRRGLAHVRSAPSSTATVPLLPALECSTSEDRRSLAHVRLASTSSSSSTAVTVSRTTEWRRRKMASGEETGPTGPRPKKARKEYCCKMCNDPMNAG